jgi:hypothetical protein
MTKRYKSLQMQDFSIQESLMTSNRKLKSSVKIILMRRSKLISKLLILTWPKLKWKKWRKRSVRLSLF